MLRRKEKKKAFSNSTESNLKRALERISSADTFQGIPLRLSILAPLRLILFSCFHVYLSLFEPEEAALGFGDVGAGD